MQYILMVWEELIKVALIGTDLSELSEGTKNALEELGIDIDDSPARVLLEGASIYSLMQKAGFQPQELKLELPKTCNDETSKICSKKSTDHLAQILNEIYEEVLEEFIQYLIHYKRNLPPEMLPELLEKCRSDKKLWEQIRFAIGERGYWLIEQNPDWQFLAGKTEIEKWETGTKNERLTILQYLRRNDPATALEKIESTWEEDDWKLRKEFVQQLELNLSLADEFFLEKCLDDKRKDIRTTAAELLSQIEGSAYIERMFEYIKRFISIKKRKLKKDKINIELPDALTEEMLRDGINPRKKWNKGGLKASYFAQMFIIIPPSKWESFFGSSEKSGKKKPEEVLSIFVRSEWSELLVQAVIESSINWKNEKWMTAIVNFYFENYDKQRWEDLKMNKLFEVLPTKIFNRVARKALAKFKVVLDGDEPVCALLENSRDKSWDKELTILLMKNIKSVISQNINYSWQYVHYRNMLDAAAFGSDPNLYEPLNKNWSNNENYWTNWGKEIDNFLQILKFRRDMILELQRIELTNK